MGPWIEVGGRCVGSVHSFYFWRKEWKWCEGRFCIGLYCIVCTDAIFILVLSYSKVCGMITFFMNSLSQEVALHIWLVVVYLSSSILPWLNTISELFPFNSSPTWIHSLIKRVYKWKKNFDTLFMSCFWFTMQIYKFYHVSNACMLVNSEKRLDWKNLTPDLKSAHKV